MLGSIFLHRKADIKRLKNKQAVLNVFFVQILQIFTAVNIFIEFQDRSWSSFVVTVTSRLAIMSLSDMRMALCREKHSKGTVSKTSGIAFSTWQTLGAVLSAANWHIPLRIILYAVLCTYVWFVRFSQSLEINKTQ